MPPTPEAAPTAAELDAASAGAVIAGLLGAVQLARSRAGRHRGRRPAPRTDRGKRS